MHNPWCLQLKRIVQIYIAHIELCPPSKHNRLLYKPFGCHKPSEFRLFHSTAVHDTYTHTAINFNVLFPPSGCIATSIMNDMNMCVFLATYSFKTKIYCGASDNVGYFKWFCNTTMPRRAEGVFADGWSGQCCVDINCNIPKHTSDIFKKNPIIRNSFDSRLSYLMALYFRNIPSQ